jgi:hypothetical protein
MGATKRRAETGEREKTRQPGTGATSARKAKANQVLDYGVQVVKYQESKIPISITEKAAQFACRQTDLIKVDGCRMEAWE